MRTRTRSYLPKNVHENLEPPQISVAPPCDSAEPPCDSVAPPQKSVALIKAAHPKSTDAPLGVNASQRGYSSSSRIFIISTAALATEVPGPKMAATPAW